MRFNMFYGVAATAFVAMVPDSMMVSGVSLNNIESELALVPTLKAGYESLKASSPIDGLAQIEETEAPVEKDPQAAKEEAEPTYREEKVSTPGESGDAKHHASTQRTFAAARRTHFMKF